MDGSLCDEYTTWYITVLHMYLYTTLKTVVLQDWYMCRIVM